jgi:hypothetical protein
VSGFPGTSRRLPGGCRRRSRAGGHTRRLWEGRTRRPEHPARGHDRLHLAALPVTSPQARCGPRPGHDFNGGAVGRSRDAEPSQVDADREPRAYARRPGRVGGVSVSRQGGHPVNGNRPKVLRCASCRTRTDRLSSSASPPPPRTAAKDRSRRRRIIRRNTIPTAAGASRLSARMPTRPTAGLICAGGFAGSGSERVSHAKGVRSGERWGDAVGSRSEPLRGCPATAGSAPVLTTGHGVRAVTDDRDRGLRGVSASLTGGRPTATS